MIDSFQPRWIFDRNEATWAVVRAVFRETRPVLVALTIRSRMTRDAREPQIPW